jgi:Protein of unknown function (DUF1822)
MNTHNIILNHHPDFTLMNDNHTSTFTVNLDRTAHEWAAKFAAGQTSIAKGRQVYLNTLAVYAVRHYLSCVCQLDLDLDRGDSWQVELQSIMNVADLVIPNVGKIECLPVLLSTSEIELPIESIGDRIGYVIVQFSDELNSVKLLGFVTRPELDIISLTQLQPLDSLLDLIYSLRVSNLSEFLSGMLGLGWEPIENLMTTDRKNPLVSKEFSLRNTGITTPSDNSYDSIRDFTAGKTINLSASISSIPLLLLIGLNQQSDGRVQVKIRLHSGGGVPVLPATIELLLKAANGDLLSQVKYPRAMNFIQLPSFKLEPGKEFKIQVVLGDDSFTESFVA